MELLLIAIVRIPRSSRLSAGWHRSLEPQVGPAPRACSSRRRRWAQAECLGLALRFPVQTIGRREQRHSSGISSMRLRCRQVQGVLQTTSLRLGATRRMR